MRGLRYGAEDVARAVECGIRSFLIADIGLLRLLREMQSGGELPVDLVWKISVMMAPSNPLSLRLLEELGATTANIPSDVTLEQLAEFRAASRCHSTSTSSRPIPSAVSCAATSSGTSCGRRAALREVRAAELPRAYPRERTRRGRVCDRA